MRQVDEDQHRLNTRRPALTLKTETSKRCAKTVCCLNAKHCRINPYRLPQISKKLSKPKGKAENNDHLENTSVAILVSVCGKLDQNTANPMCNTWNVSKPAQSLKDRSGITLTSMKTPHSLQHTRIHLRVIHESRDRIQKRFRWQARKVPKNKNSHDSLRVQQEPPRDRNTRKPRAARRSILEFPTSKPY